MRGITITDHHPHCEAASGDTVHFEHEGRQFHAEYGAARHGSEIDIYNSTVGRLNRFAVDGREELDDQIKRPSGPSDGDAREWGQGSG